MSETANLVMANAYVEDMAQGTGTGTVTRRAADGTQTTVTRTQINSGNFGVLTQATLTLLGLAGTKYPDDAFAALVAGAGIAKSNLSVYGVTRSSVTTATPQSLDVSDPVYGYIPTGAQKAGLAASGTGADAPSATNYYPTLSQAYTLSLLGDGSDGAGQIAAITDPVTVPVIADSSVAGNLTGTFTYKIAAANMSGETLPTGASSSSGSLTSKQIRLTLPALPSGASFWKVYRSNGGTYYYVGRTTGTTFYDNNTVASSATTVVGANSTSATAATLAQAFYNFTSLTIANGQTATMASGQQCLMLVQGAVVMSGTGQIVGDAKFSSTGDARILATHYNPTTGYNDACSTAGTAVYVGSVGKGGIGIAANRTLMGVQAGSGAGGTLRIFCATFTASATNVLTCNGTAAPGGRIDLCATQWVSVPSGFIARCNAGTTTGTNQGGAGGGQLNIVSPVINDGGATLTATGGSASASTSGAANGAGGPAHSGNGGDGGNNAAGTAGSAGSVTKVEGPGAVPAIWQLRMIA